MVYHILYLGAANPWKLAAMNEIFGSIHILKGCWPKNIAMVLHTCFLL